jgi:riboflavin biosynthesis pyrimidine reductase
MPAELQRIYGRLGFGERTIYSNFVTSLDGVVTLGSTPSAGSVISGRNRWDRFLMGLLRACADAVLLGAGTLRATPGHHWTPEHIFPDMASSFAQLRSTLGRKPGPRLILLTASGKIAVSHAAVVGGATILTTASGASALAGRLPESCDVIEVGETGPVDLGRGVEELRSRGHEVILTEGGPHVAGELIAKGLLDEAFITISPVVAGRDRETRLGMVAGVELLPAGGVWSRLLSARRQGEYLFLRYGLRPG